MGFFHWKSILFALLLSGLINTSTAKKLSRHHSQIHHVTKSQDDLEDYKDLIGLPKEGDDKALCENWWCSQGRECQIVHEQGEDDDRPMPRPQCVCIAKCPEEEEGVTKKRGGGSIKRGRSVCGTDGRFYSSTCELYRSACLKNTPELRVDDDPGRCSFNEDEDDDSSYENDEYTYPDEVDYDKGTDREILRSTTPISSTLCSEEEYEVFKDNLLLVNREKLVEEGRFNFKEFQRDQEDDLDDSEEFDDSDEEGEADYERDRGSWKRINGDDGGRKKRDYFLSLLFSHFDQNNDGALEINELERIWNEENTQSSNSIDRNCNLLDLLRYDDTDHDGRVDVNEFYSAFNKLYSISVISLDKALETIPLVANVNDNLEIRCDIMGSPPVEPIIWKRFGVDLRSLKNSEDYFRILPDGTLLLNKIQPLHDGNFSCHAQRNEKVIQTHVLSVQSPPDVHVLPHIIWEKPGGEVTMECRAQGEPPPKVEWLKNDEPVQELEGKIQVKGDSIYLTLKDIYFSDTGAYMCAGENAAARRLDITSLVVIDQSPSAVEMEQKKALGSEHSFIVFHEDGIAFYDPANCRLQHQIQSTDLIPGTQDYVCMEEDDKCEWGAAIRVSNTYIYASQPKLDRVIVISTAQFLVVDVIPTDRYPVELHYVTHLDQVWVECWRRDIREDEVSGSPSDGEKTLLVIREASEKKKHHHTVHPEPIDSHFDLVQHLFLPPEEALGQFRHGYVSHRNARGLYKMDLIALRYVSSVDLTPYNCYPQGVRFSSLYGMVFVDCVEPVTLKPTGQLVIDALTDSVTLFKKNDRFGRSFLSPDSRKVVTLSHTPRGSTLLVQNIKENSELGFAFDVKTSLNLTDLTFFPSLENHSFDLYGVSSKDDVLFLDLNSGKVELIPGIGGVGESSKRRQSISSQQKFFSQFLATISSNLISNTSSTNSINNSADSLLHVLNGMTRTVNCQISRGLSHPKLIVWT